MTFVYDYEHGFDVPGDKNAWFGERIGSDKLVLEVGCATGYVGEYLVTHRSCELFGIEVVPYAAERARARDCYTKVLTGDITDPATVSVLARASFDFVLFGDVLEHLFQPELALANVSPLLKPDGRLLICVPSIIHWSIRKEILLGRFNYTDSGPLDRTHVHFFTPASIRELVRAAGFQIVDESGVVWLPKVFRRLPLKLRRRLETIAGATVPNVVYGQVLICAARD